MNAVKVDFLPVIADSEPAKKTEVPVLSGKTQTKGNADPNISMTEEGAAKKRFLCNPQITDFKGLYTWGLFMLLF